MHGRHRGALRGRDLLEALDLGVEIALAQKGQALWDSNRVSQLPVNGNPPNGERRSPLGLIQPFDSGKLDRLVLGQEAGRPVANRYLDRRDRRCRTNGTRNPSRWYRSRRPLSKAAAYTLATPNPATMKAARIMWVV